jgi:TonB family protein
MRLTHSLAGLAAIVAALPPSSWIAPARAAPHVGAQPPGDGEAGARPAQLVRTGGSLIANSDYPLEAIAKREQGVVRIALSIDRAGRVTGCSVLAPSGSPSLDAASCQLTSQRAQFHPARNASGEPVSSTHIMTIRWALPAAGPRSEIEIAYQAWYDCALAESATHAGSALSHRDIIRRVETKCARQENEAARVLDTELAIIPARTAIRQAIADQISRLRRRPSPSSPAAPRNR